MLRNMLSEAGKRKADNRNKLKTNWSQRKEEGDSSNWRRSKTDKPRKAKIEKMMFVIFICFRLLNGFHIFPIFHLFARRFFKDPFFSFEKQFFARRISRGPISGSILKHFSSNIEAFLNALCLTSWQTDMSNGSPFLKDPRTRIGSYSKKISEDCVLKRRSSPGTRRTSCRCRRSRQRKRSGHLPQWSSSSRRRCTRTRPRCSRSWRLRYWRRVGIAGRRTGQCWSPSRSSPNEST